MAGFIFFKKFTPEEAKDIIVDISQWFRDNPKRRMCQTDLGFKVRRGHITEDVMARTKSAPVV
jgi:hypothetical protein